MAVGRMQAITAIVLAYAVLLLLVSPAVPSPITTLRSKQMVHPPQGIAPVTSPFIYLGLRYHALLLA